MEPGKLAIGAGSAVKHDPVGSAKVFLFFALAIVVLFLVWKFLKGIGRVSQALGDLGPMSNEEKEKIASDPKYQRNLKWLDDRIGIETIVREGKFKNVSDYLQHKNFPFEVIAKAANQIWEAGSGAGSDEGAIYSAVGSMPSKAAVSLLAQTFNTVYKSRVNFDRLDTFLSTELDVNEMQSLMDIIDKKPTL